MNELVLNDEQMKVLGSHTVSESYHKLAENGECTISEIAVLIEKSPETVHYHFKELLRVGLIKKIGTRPAKRKPERVYAVVSRRLRLPEGKSENLHREKLIQSGMRARLRMFERASRFAENDERLRKQFMVIQTTFDLDEESFEEFRRRIDELAEEFASRSKQGAPVRISWSTLIFPIKDKKSKD